MKIQKAEILDRGVAHVFFPMDEVQALPDFKITLNKGNLSHHSL